MEEINHCDEEQIYNAKIKECAALHRLMGSLILEESVNVIDDLSYYSRKLKEVNRQIDRV